MLSSNITPKMDLAEREEKIKRELSNIVQLMKLARLDEEYQKDENQDDFSQRIERKVSKESKTKDWTELQAQVQGIREKRLSEREQAMSAYFDVIEEIRVGHIVEREELMKYGNIFGPAAITALNRKDPTSKTTTSVRKGFHSTLLTRPLSPYKRKAKPNVEKEVKVGVKERISYSRINDKPKPNLLPNKKSSNLASAEKPPPGNHPFSSHRARRVTGVSTGGGDKGISNLKPVKEATLSNQNPGSRDPPTVDLHQAEDIPPKHGAIAILQKEKRFLQNIVSDPAALACNEYPSRLDEMIKSTQMMNPTPLPPRPPNQRSRLTITSTSKSNPSTNTNQSSKSHDGKTKSEIQIRPVVPKPTTSFSSSSVPAPTSPRQIQKPIMLKVPGEMRPVDMQRLNKMYQNPEIIDESEKRVEKWLYDHTHKQSKIISRAPFTSTVTTGGTGAKPSQSKRRKGKSKKNKSGRKSKSSKLKSKYPDMRPKGPKIFGLSTPTDFNETSEAEVNPNINESKAKITIRTKVLPFPKSRYHRNME